MTTRSIPHVVARQPPEPPPSAGPPACREARLESPEAGPSRGGCVREGELAPSCAERGGCAVREHAIAGLPDKGAWLRLGRPRRIEHGEGVSAPEKALRTFDEHYLRRTP
eukprot:CAMPEP_0180274542 /NCGR_PEP_ID=MMETSP0988-20121125/5378_1 /TAXON_ID=697907 /ORGANISM="non described non described, Strain CCMP2293" /LENGTH=109 /DNA_ID=CAMNT_0022245775 /DNA_START=57 /DNA_END=387 /DNA_ORIENTATION=+